ncbi:MAG: glycosyltransferase [SAR324 cluster bacterium]|nr:glycosyltransferase [SAR324 cluster bacterium]
MDGQLLGRQRLAGHPDHPGRRRPRLCPRPRGPTGGAGSDGPLPSRFEGFANVLCEAMARGLPAVAFDCPFGPGEIIRHQEDGLLVPPEDVDALAKALDSMISDPDRPGRMGETARKITDRFGLESVMSQWEDLLTRVTAG